DGIRDRNVTGVQTCALPIAIVEPYDTAVQKLAIKVSEMIPTLPDPTSWQDIERDEEKKEAFILAYKDTIEQLNLVEQYYEFKWDERAFGINEHTLLRYVGAYRNLTWEPGAPEPITSPTVLVGKTKLSGTQVIDASHIINLIGSKTTSSNGKQT